MKLRRVRTPSGLQLQPKDPDGQGISWPTIHPLGTSPFSNDWRLATAERHLQYTDSLLPFDPLSFRDFLLSGQHTSRVLPERFYPATFGLTRALERLKHEVESLGVAGKAMGVPYRSTTSATR